MTRAPWLTETQLAAWKHLSLMQLHLESALARGLAAAGLSYPDYLVLATLADREGGRCRVVELGEELGWEKSRTSHQLKRMGARGLIDKERCPSDLRGSYAVITELGRAAARAAAPAHVAQVRDLFIDCVTPEQLAVIDEVARGVLERLAP